MNAKDQLLIQESPGQTKTKYKVRNGMIRGSIDKIVEQEARHIFSFYKSP